MTPVRPGNWVAVGCARTDDATGLFRNASRLRAFSEFADLISLEARSVTARMPLRTHPGLSHQLL